jgi:uncharacterized protein
MSAQAAVICSDSAVDFNVGIERQLDSFRATRREIEASVLPLATSVDGRRFTFQASLHSLQLQVGAYAVLDDGGGVPRLGQVLALEMDQQPGAELMLPLSGGDAPAARTEIQYRYARGHGVIIDGDLTPFHDALIRVATETEVQAWQQSRTQRHATLWLGDLALAAGVPCLADARGFSRHTFLCGQSGSGKTYSLGVMLERLLIETDLRVVVLDPNSDFVRLGQVRSGADPVLAERYRRQAGEVAVYSAHAGGERRLRLHAAEVEPDAQAAALRLDPIADRDEYAALAAFLASSNTPAMEALNGSDRPEAHGLGLRLANLGVDRYTVWARGEAGSVLDAVHDESVRCVVVDLGSLPTREEQSLVAAVVLGDLWRRRAERRPVLIVIDEAHNVCPAEPPDLLAALATDHAIRIAAEGRKFGLYLLVSTQRPQKIPENVLSQADNLVLLRLNSLADAAFAQAAFSFVPPSLIQRSATFRQGEGLIAGRSRPSPRCSASARGSARRAAPTCRPPGHPRGNGQTYSRRRIQVRVRKPQIGGR